MINQLRRKKNLEKKSRSLEKFSRKQSAKHHSDKLVCIAIAKLMVREREKEYNA